MVILPFHGHGLTPTLGEVPAVDLADLITQPAGDPRYIGAGRCPKIQFFFQKVDLRFPHSGLVGTVKQMIGTIMMDGLAAQVAQLVNKPGGLFDVPVTVKTVPDVAAFDFLVADMPPGP